MGKHLRQKSTGISVQSSHPGCMWNILHILKYHHWRYVKQRLPHKRRRGGRHAEGDGNPGYEKLQEQNEEEMDNSIDGKKMTQSTPATKNSVTARLKALFSEEMSKRKGRHHRSSTYPVRSHLTRSDSIHHLEPSDDPFIEITLDDLNPSFVEQNNESSCSTSSLDPMLPNFSEEPVTSCEEWSATFTADDLGHDQVNKNGKQRIDNNMLDDTKQALSEQKLIHAKELTTDASLHQSKELLDALDLINLNKEFFFKVLQDPGSLLAQHFHSKQEFSAKMRLTKSGSFPLHGSSDTIDPGPSKLKLKQEDLMSNVKEEEKLQGGNHTQKSQSTPSIAAEHRVDGLKLNQAMAEIVDNSSSGSSKHLKNRHGNQMVIKRFLDLKQKIKHAIKESKKEKHRITMDAILHKIPHNQGFSKDLKKDIFDQLKDSTMNSDHSVRSIGKSGGRHFKRTSSLGESMNRYCQLYDSSSKRETKEVALPSRTALKTLGRIFSSPDLRSYFYSSEDSPDSAGVDGTVSIRNSFDEQKSIDLPIASEYHSQLDASIKSEMQENLVDVSEKNSVIGDHVGSTTGSAEISTSEDAELKLRNLLPGELDSLANQQHESSKDTPTVDENEVDLEKVEIPSKHLDSDILHVQVDTKDKVQFNYVRDVLELSGFSGNESIGTWHSDDQPMDPSVYEEVEGCMVLDPDCPGHEEGGNCNHLLLFDLINEMLMEIYESSFTYFPKQLSSLSHIRPMPVGYHVLEEVWTQISWYLSSKPGADQSLDYVVSRDLAKNDGWMNLQFDTECVGLELEDLIFDDLLEEVI